MILSDLCNVIKKILKKLYSINLLSFVETPRKFITAELSIRKLGSSSSVGSWVSQNKL